MKIQSNQTGMQQSAAKAVSQGMDNITLAKMIKDRVDKIEEIPDYNKRQDQVMKLFVKAQSETKDSDVKDLLRVSTVSANSRNTVYSAVKIARITHEALVNGCYGNAPLLAGTARKMFDTLQFEPRKKAAERILTEMIRRSDEPEAQAAFSMAKKIQDNIFSDYTGDHSISVARDALSSVENGFNGSPSSIIQLGTKLCRDAFESDFEGRKLQPAIDKLIDAAPNSQKPTFRFAWEMARSMDGEEASNFMQSMVDSGTSMPGGDEGRLHIAEKALEKYQDRQQLSGASDVILKAFTSKTQGKNRKKIFNLARKINLAINPGLSQKSYDEDNLSDTSALVRISIKEAKLDTPLNSDKQVLTFARKLIGSTESGFQGTNNDLCNLLISEINDPQCKKILSFTREITGEKGGNNVVAMGIDTALKSLEGGKVNLAELGRSMVESFPFSKADSYRTLMGFLARDSSYSDCKNMLKLGEAATKGMANFEGRPAAARKLLDIMGEGQNDKTTDPLELARELFQAPSAPDDKFNVMEEMARELPNQFKDPEVKEFLKFAGSFVKSCADYSYSNTAFERALDKAGELRATGNKFKLVDDSLDVINAVPDKLIQANMLRQVVLEYAGDLVKANKIGSAVENPIESLSAMGDSSTGRLQIGLDFLNVLSFNESNPQGTYNLLGEVYRRLPEKNRDIAAMSFFYNLKGDPGSDNQSKTRETYMKPEDWKSLQDLISGAQKEKNTFNLIKNAIQAIEKLGHQDPKDTRKDYTKGAAQGAASFIILQEMENRGAGHPGIEKVLTGYKDSCEKEEYHISSEKAQSAILEIARLMIKEMGQKDGNVEIVSGEMDTRWKQGDPENNRKLLMESLEDIDKFNRGIYEGVGQWAADKVLGGESKSKPTPKVECDDNYVIIGGVIFPKNKA